MIMYLIENMLNSKIYVGITVGNVDRRYKGHLRQARLGSETALHCAIRKYGPESFRLSVIGYADNRDTLQQMEIAEIEKRNCRAPFGYNLTLGGDGFSGKHTEKAKIRMKISQKAWRDTQTDEHRVASNAAITLALRGKKRPNIGPLVSLINKGRVRSEEYKKKVSAGTKKMIANLPPGEMSRRASLTKVAIEAKRRRVAAGLEEPS